MSQETKTKSTLSDYRGLIAWAIMSIFVSLTIYSGEYAWYYWFTDSPISSLIIGVIGAAGLMYAINGFVQKQINKKCDGFKKYAFSFITYVICMIWFSMGFQNLIHGGAIGFSWFNTIFGSAKADVLNGVDTAIVLSMIAYIGLYISGDNELKATVKNKTGKVLHLASVKTDETDTKETVETDTGDDTDKTDTGDETKTG